MRLAEITALPPTLTTERAAELFGVSPDLLWRLARDGEAPVTPLRLGRALRWPTALVLAALGMGDPDPPDDPNDEGPRRGEPIVTALDQTDISHAG